MEFILRYVSHHGCFMNDIEKMTRKAQEAMQAAATMAEERKHSAVEPEHLFYQLLKQDDGIVPTVAKAAGADVPGLESDLEASFRKMPEVTGASRKTYASPRLVEVFKRA